MSFKAPSGPETESKWADCVGTPAIKPSSKSALRTGIPAAASDLPVADDVSGQAPVEIPALSLLITVKTLMISPTD